MPYARSSSPSASSGAEFPSEIAGLVLRLEADDITSADGTAVSSWADASGQGNHAVQATGAAQPSVQTDEISGLPVVRFASGDYLQTVAGAPLTDCHVFAVFKHTDNTSEYQMVGGFGEEAAGKRRLLLVQTPAGATRGRIGFNGYGNPADVQGTTRTDTNQSSFYVGEFSKSGSTVSVRRDGEHPITGTPTHDVYTSTVITVGGNNAGGENFRGDIAAFYVYSRQLSEAERITFGTYLRKKFAVAYNMGRVVAYADDAAGAHRFESNAASDDVGVISQNFHESGVSHFVALKSDEPIPGGGRGGAWGIGNAGVGAPFADAVYMEGYELDTVSAPPPVRIVQTGVLAGSHAIRKRFEFDANGDMHVYDTSGAAMFTILANGVLIIKRTTVPADGDLAANQAALWFDPTNGASALKIKAKQADGTVKTATIALA